MLNLNAIRKWLRNHDSDNLILMTEYVEKESNKEIPMVEARLILLLGEMDYTTASHIEKSLYESSPTTAQEKLLTRIAWETQRDTKVTIDIESALNRGKQYQEE